jgi:hypothetical protein
MKASIARGVFLAIFGILSLAAGAVADTLQMRDGRVIQGRYAGGTQSHIRFVVNGTEELFAVKDVADLTFTDTASGPVVGSSAYDEGARGATVTVPAGTTLKVRMIDTVDSSKSKVGDQFTASLEDALVIGNTVVAPKGADVYGRLAEAKSAGHISGSSELQLELTGIRINGNIQPIVTGEYSVAGKGRGKQSAERIGGGAAVGAIIGAIAGGGKGAAIGAGVGAGAGTAVQVVTHGEQVNVPSETLLDFTLSQPLTVTPSSRND